MLQEFTTELEKTAKSVVNDIHTALPGEIVSFDGGTASVQPIGKYITSDGKSLDYPLICEAPVCFPYCQNAGVGFAFPVKKGDSCIIIISEVELDSWRSGAKSEGSLRFDLTSAMVIPGLFEGGCEAVVRATSQNAAIMSCGDAEIVVSGGGCKLTSGGASLTVSDGGVTISGSLMVSGEVKASGDVQTGAISLKNHTHTDSEGGKTTKAE